MVMAAWRLYRRRLGALTAGLFISALGITMMLQAHVGLEPWSVLQDGLSVFFGISYGTAVMLVGLMAVCAAAALGEGFGLGTLANIFLCPVFIDALLYLGWIPQMRGLWSGLALLLLGMELLALGTWLYMKSTLGAGPRDALMVVLARRTGRSVGLCRCAVEVLAVAVGWLLGGQVGIGTVVTALGIGALLNANFALLHFPAREVRQENLPQTLRQLKMLRSPPPSE